MEFLDGENKPALQMKKLLPENATTFHERGSNQKDT